MLIDPCGVRVVFFRLPGASEASFYKITFGRVVFFRLPGASEASFYKITFGRTEERGRQGLQIGGCQPQPPPLQTGINTKILNISPEGRRLFEGSEVSKLLCGAVLGF